MKALSSLKPLNLLNQFSKKNEASTETSINEKAPAKKAPVKTKKSAE